MNQKERKSDLSLIQRVLQETCNVADLILKKENPCDPKMRDGKFTCINPASHFCCSGCKHLRESGCIVSSPACKLWLCGYSDNQSQYLRRVLLSLNEATLHKMKCCTPFYTFRSSIEEIMEQIEDKDDSTIEKIADKAQEIERVLLLAKNLIKLYEGE